VALKPGEATDSRWKRLGDMLFEAGLITRGQLEEALAEKGRQKCFLGQALVKLGYISQGELISFLVKQCKIPHISLIDYQIDPRIVRLLPNDLCLKYKLLAIDSLGSILTIAMVNPLDIDALEHARAACPNLKLKPILCTPDHFEIVAKRVLLGNGSEASEKPTEAAPLSLSSFGLSPIKPLAAAPPPSEPETARVPAAAPEQGDYAVLVREILGELLNIFQGPATTDAAGELGPLSGLHQRDLQFSFTLSVAGEPCYVSDAVVKVLGHGPDHFKEQFLELLTDHPANPVLRRAIRLSCAGQQHAPIEAEFIGADGGARMLHVALIPVFDSARALVAVQGVARDITRRERTEEHVFRVANHDPLTGLLNRRNFMARLAEAVPMARRHGSPLSAGVINLDRFTELNREFGHAEGDKVLVAFGHILRESLRVEDSIARTGGDEFCVLMPQVQPDEAFNGLTRCKETLSEAKLVAADGRSMAITMTGALVSLHEGNQDPERLLEAARAAVLTAKSEAGDRVVIAVAPS